MNVAASGAKRYSCSTNSKPPSFLLFPWHIHFETGIVLLIPLPKRRVAEYTSATDFKLSGYRQIKLTLMGQRPGKRCNKDVSPDEACGIRRLKLRPIA